MILVASGIFKMPWGIGKVLKNFQVL